MINAIHLNILLLTTKIIKIFQLYYLQKKKNYLSNVNNNHITR